MLLNQILKSIFKLKIVRYFLVGTVGASTDISIFFILTSLIGLNWPISSIISSIISVLLGYYLSIKFVFQSGLRFKKYQEIAGIFLISAIAFLMHQSLLFIFIEFFNINMIISKVITIGLIFFFNYFTRSKIIFPQHN